MMNTTTGIDYKTLFDLNPLPLIIYDPDSLRILDVNEASTDLYGYSRSELLSFKLPVLFFDNSLNEINTPEKLNGRSRICHRKKDGTKITVIVKVKDITLGSKPARLETIIPADPEPAADYLRLLFTSVIESSDDYIISKDLDGKILSWNKGAEKLYGWKAGEVIGRSVEIIAPPDKKDEIKDIMRSLRQGKRYDHYETRRVTKDGKTLWVSLTITPLKDISGKIIGASAIGRDVTKSKETMARLKENEVIFKHLIENLTEVFYVSNPAKPEVIYISNAYEKVFGEPVENIYESPNAYLSYIVDEDQLAAKKAIVNQLNGISTDNTYRIMRPDGKMKYLRERAFPVKDSSGKVNRVIGIADDITERIESENELKRSEYRYRSIFESTAVSMWESDDSEVVKLLDELKAEGVGNFKKYFNEHPEFVKECYGRLKLVDANPQSVAMFKAESKQNLIKNLGDYLTDDFYNKFKDFLVARADGGKRFEAEYELRTFSGEPIHVYSITNFPDDNSPYKYTIASLVDITQRKKDELGLSKALAREQRALFQAEEVQDKLEYLAEASYILNSSLDYTETIRSLAKLLTPSICDWFAVDLAKGDGVDRLIVYHKDPEKIRFAEQLRNKYPPDLNQPNGVHNVIRTGRSELYSQISDEFLRRNIKEKELLVIFKELGIKSIMIVPLKVRGRVLGAITLCTAESDVQYDEDDLRFAEDIALRAAMAIDNASLFRQIGELNKNLEETIRLQQQEIKYRKKIERDLRESEERFRLITENSNDFISLLDENEIFIYANPALMSELGYSADELIGKISPRDLVYEEDRELLQAYSRRPIIEIRYNKKNGGFVWVESSSLRVNYHGKAVTVRISRDITERKRIETERVKLYSQLELQRVRIDNLIANVPGVVWEIYGRPGTDERKISFISGYVEKLLGYKPEFWLNDAEFTRKVVHPDDLESVMERLGKQYREKKSSMQRYRWIAKDGSVVWVESHSTCICDSDNNVIGLRGVNIDITEQVKFENELSESLREKEILLKEIHHRVKNNMQVISSLLSLQSHSIPDKLTQEIFDESRNRIRSMALIHEKLYQSKDLFNINFDSYVRDLLNNLLISYGVKGNSITTKVDIDNISFDINSAISLGLIINELASNSYKHAFKGRKSGEIYVTIRKSPAIPPKDPVIPTEGRDLPPTCHLDRRERSSSKY